MKMIRQLTLLPAIILILTSCDQGFITRSDRDTKLLQYTNSLDPRGSGTVDPRLAAPKTILDQGVTRIYFNKGENEVTFKIKPTIPGFSKKDVACDTSITACPGYQELLNSPALKNLGTVKGEITVDDVTVNVDIDASRLLPDLSHALDLFGLANNSVIKIKGTAFDKSGKVIGSKEFQKTVTGKVDTVELEIMIGNIQEKIN
jgi:hypothetical protein